eukprot:1098421-Rhodomonas_salina.2
MANDFRARGNAVLTHVLAHRADALDATVSKRRQLPRHAWATKARACLGLQDLKCWKRADLIDAHVLLRERAHADRAIEHLQAATHMSATDIAQPRQWRVARRSRPVFET